LSLTGLISPVPFDPAQHVGTIGIWSIEPQNPFPLVAGGKGRGDTVNIEKNGAKPKDLLVRAGEFFDEIVLLDETSSLCCGTWRTGRGGRNTRNKRLYFYSRGTCCRKKRSDAEI
jgi:hypothetical protein